jgi:hypothetical protein
MPDRIEKLDWWDILLLVGGMLLAGLGAMLSGRWFAFWAMAALVPEVAIRLLRISWALRRAEQSLAEIVPDVRLSSKCPVLLSFV